MRRATLPFARLAAAACRAQRAGTCFVDAWLRAHTHTHLHTRTLAQPRENQSACFPLRATCRFHGAIASGSSPAAAAPGADDDGDDGAADEELDESERCELASDMLGLSEPMMVRVVPGQEGQSHVGNGDAPRGQRRVEAHRGARAEGGSTRALVEEVPYATPVAPASRWLSFPFVGIALPVPLRWHLYAGSGRMLGVHVCVCALTPGQTHLPQYEGTDKYAPAPTVGLVCTRFHRARSSPVISTMLGPGGGGPAALASLLVSMRMCRDAPASTAADSNGAAKAGASAGLVQPATTGANRSAFERAAAAAAAAGVRLETMPAAERALLLRMCDDEDVLQEVMAGAPSRGEGSALPNAAPRLRGGECNVVDTYQLVPEQGGAAPLHLFGIEYLLGGEPATRTHHHTLIAVDSVRDAVTEVHFVSPHGRNGEYWEAAWHGGAGMAGARGRRRNRAGADAAAIAEALDTRMLPGAALLDNLTLLPSASDPEDSASVGGLEFDAGSQL